MIKGGINPKKLQAIKYCKKHNHYINLLPVCHLNMVKGKNGYRVVCPDCGAFGKTFDSPIQAIEYWNENCGVSIIPSV